ncbi:MAG: hypothetical protein QXG00_03495 [Candidatus Woesearchaeota archaeon]
MAKLSSVFNVEKLLNSKKSIIDIITQLENIMLDSSISIDEKETIISNVYQVIQKNNLQFIKYRIMFYLGNPNISESSLIDYLKRHNNNYSFKKPILVSDKEKINETSILDNVEKRKKELMILETVRNSVYNDLEKILSVYRQIHLKIFKEDPYSLLLKYHSK